MAWYDSSAAREDVIFAQDLVAECDAEAFGVWRIGVNRGEFAQRVLDIVMPARLHPIDPWTYEIGERYSQRFTAAGEARVKKK